MNTKLTHYSYFMVYLTKATVNDIHVSGQEFPTKPRGRAVIIIIMSLLQPE